MQWNEGKEEKIKKVEKWKNMTKWRRRKEKEKQEENWLEQFLFKHRVAYKLDELRFGFCLDLVVYV